ncbi:MAG: hypothetical protein OEZ68_09325 [Gammaproteobacteria bacterium]|nr:hypothetical protein [Gammaproteobacteria bacterium]MDH5800989.1 hypothetical protein [Gammaproteobacteria bacterium]
MNDWNKWVAVIAGAVLFTASYNTWAADWQKQRLLNPDTQDLVLEREGQVFIYDGISDKDIAGAMDAYFERIGSMMFINTQWFNPKSGVMEQDDDC